MNSRFWGGAKGSEAPRASARLTFAQGASPAGRSRQDSPRSRSRRGGRVRTPFDARAYQIAALAGLLAYGMAGLAFEVSIARVGLLLATALATQYVGGRLASLPRFDPRSALISGLSLCLLLRTNS